MISEKKGRNPKLDDKLGNTLIVIDFFCGCGGASEGLRQAGFDVELGIDIDAQASETDLPPRLDTTLS
ncbi:TPA: DNA cytosine methyltransferase [Escherichia coli]